MAVSIQTMSLASGLKIVRDSDADATVEANVNSGAATLWLIKVDNSANSTDKVWLKIWNATAPAISTAVDISIPVAAGATLRCAIPLGLALATGLSFAVAKSNGTASTASPTNDVAVALVFS